MESWVPEARGADVPSAVPGRGALVLGGKEAHPAWREVPLQSPSHIQSDRALTFTHLVSVSCGGHRVCPAGVQLQPGAVSLLQIQGPFSSPEPFVGQFFTGGV